MFDSPQSLRHVAYFNELATLEEDNPQWRAVSAGLVVLRLIDSWIDEGPLVVATDSWQVRSVFAAIDEMPDVPARSILRSTVESVVDTSTVDMQTVSPRLMAYARSLDADARYALAADVYETVIAYSHPTDEADQAIHAHVRLSYCRRMLGELEDAEEIAIQAGRIANAAGDIVGTLRARIAEAKVSVARGNYPEAEALFDSTIRDATNAGLDDHLRGQFIQERSDVAHLKGEYEYAIRLGYEALDKLTDDRLRDRMLGDIASSFYLLGIRSAARDAWTLLSVTAQEQYVRWASRINLMDVASHDGSLAMFERHRRYLGDAALPPLLRAQYLIHAGDGFARFGNPEAARDHLTEAMSFAAQYGFNRLVFYAEELMENVSKPFKAIEPESPMPDSLAPIATALKGRQAGVIAMR